jgi:transcriptional regulator with XRE-family HTH domain
MRERWENHLAKPDWQTKRRDGDRGQNRARDYREPVVLQLASSRRPNGPREDRSKPQVVKQGVNGALRAANLRLLLEHAPVREALSLVAEVPLERLEAMSQGALCPDETAFHIERTLKLPGKWLDGLNKAVPERTLELLKHPDAALHDDDFDEDAPVAQAPAIPAEQAPVAAAVTTADEPHSSAEVAQPESGPKDTHPMSSPELRKQNLSILLQGKGAKSALARLIGISQPYMSTIANGGKVLDQEFCRNVAQTLGMPKDWFETPRTASDIPAAALRLLVPLSRGAVASASAAPASGAVEAESAAAGTSSETAPEAASAPAESSKSASAVADAAASDATTTRAAQTDTAQPPRARPVPRGDDLQRTEPSRPVTASVRAPATAPAQADLLTQIELEVQPAAQATTPARHAEVMAAPAVVLNPVPVVAPVSETVHQLARRTNDFTPVSAQPLVIEGGVAPITEALIKILALKDRQGVLCEDKAFELLGAVRLL